MLHSPIYRSIKSAFLLCSVVFAAQASAASYYIACYYSDKASGLDNTDFSLMVPEATGAAKNYYWAIDSDSMLSGYTELDGKIEDGVFIENKLSYAQATEKCNIAINRGLVLWPSKSTYKLYDMKASSSNFSGYEFPIQFAQSNPADAIKRVVIFGDSLSDNGNLKRWLKVLPSYPYWYGRLSNGPVWNEYLSHSTKIPMLNWAYAGALSDSINDVDSSDVINYIKNGGRNLVTGSMKGEVDRYLQHWLTNDSYQTTSKTISSPQETLFLIWIGGNDFLSKTENEKSFNSFIDNPSSPEYYDHVANRAVDNTIEQIKRLNDAGGYHFAIFNLPNMGMAPLVVNNNHYNFQTGALKSRSELSNKITKIVEYYNALLKFKIDLLNSDRSHKIDVSLVDIYGAVEQINGNKNVFTGEPFDYEFQNPYSNVSVDASHKVPLNCFNGGFILNLLTKNNENAIIAGNDHTCKTPSGQINTQALFWDDEHPTTFGHCYLSYFVQHTLYEKGLIKTAPPALEQVKNLCKSGTFEAM